MKWTNLVALVTLGLLLSPLDSSAQERLHIFPQFVDGIAFDGNYYKSTLTILPWSGAATADCTFVLYGMTTNFEIGVGGSYFTASVPPGFSLSAPTSGKQAMQTGYGVLNCTELVFANVIVSYHAADNSKLGEATVVSAPESSRSRMTYDSRGGVRQAFAIANNGDFAKSYVVALASNGITRSTRIVVPPRRNFARFLDEILQVTPESVGLVTIYSDDSSNFSSMGFRCTGGVFTTIPPGN